MIPIYLFLKSKYLFKSNQRTWQKTCRTLWCQKISTVPMRIILWQLSRRRRFNRWFYLKTLTVQFFTKIYVHKKRAGSSYDSFANEKHLKDVSISKHLQFFVPRRPCWLWRAVGRGWWPWSSPQTSWPCRRCRGSPWLWGCPCIRYQH